MKMDFFPFLLFVTAMTVTPGPNNMLLTLFGSRFGYRKTLPFLAGIVTGILSQLCLSALGLGVLFHRYSLLQIVLKATGAVYILFLAGKILVSGGRQKSKAAGNAAPEEEIQDCPPRFTQGALFQYLNPKAYIMTLSAVSVYSLPGEDYLLSTAVILLTFALIAPLSISLWAGLGTVIGKWQTGRAGKAVSISLGMLTLGSAVFIFL